MDLLAAIAERKILEAMEGGLFDGLPGKGKPLDLPGDLELHNEIVRLRDLVDAVDDEAVRTARIKELNVKLLRFNIMKKRPVNLEGVPEYRERVMGKLASR